MLTDCPEQEICPTIFRAYDIRGIAGKTLTAEAVFLIGKAFGSYARDQGEHQIVIARDGRFSGPELSRALCDGILSVGCDVVDIGVHQHPSCISQRKFLRNIPVSC